MTVAGDRSPRVSVAPVLDYFSEHRPEELERAAREFLGDDPPADAREVPESVADPLFGGWFLFDYRTDREKRPPLEVYVQEQAGRLSPEARSHYRALLETQFFDLFEVADVVLENGMTLRRVRDGRVHEVRERMATHDLAVGDVLAARLAFTDGAWEINGGAVSLSPDMLPTLRLYFQDHPDEPPPSAKEVWSLITSASPSAPESVAEAERALDAFFTKEGQQGAIRGADVLAWLRETQDLEKTAQRVLARARLKSDESLRQLITLLSDAWRVLRPKERGTPRSDLWSGEPGPVEHALMQQFLSRISREVPPDRYRTMEAHAAAVNVFQDRWLDTPQEALNAATPRAAVREERRTRGNPDTEWEFHVTAQAFQGVEEERLRALLREGVEAMHAADWRTAEQRFRTMTEERPEHFQAWGNLGLALAAQGRKQEGLAALDRALAINPKYRLARQNREQIAATPEGELVKREPVLGASVIQVGNVEAALEEWRPLVRDEDAERTAAVRDTRAALAWFGENGPVRRTEKLKRLPQRAVLELNHRLLTPDLEVLGVGGGRVVRFRGEDDFRAVHRLHHLLIAAGLLQVRHERVSIARRAETFVAQPAAEQYLALLWAYFHHLSWEKLERVGGWLPVSYRASRAREARDAASLTVKAFLEKSTEDGWIRLRGREEEPTQTESGSSEASEQALARIMTEVDDEKFLWRPLAWFGLLELQESKEDASWSLAIAARPTPLGERLLPTLAPKSPASAGARGAAPAATTSPTAWASVGRNDPCPCGAQQDGKPVKYKKCHGR